MQQTAQRQAPRKAAGFAHPVRNVGALGVERGMRIADFGSGSGAYVFALAAELRNSGRVYAIDIQRDLLQRIHREAMRRGFHNVDVLWADLERPHASKLADHSLDLVLISNLLFQLDDKRTSLKEARRVLKATGRLAIIDWSDSPPAGGRRLGPVKKDIVTKDAAKALAVGAGFELAREFEAGAHHYGLIFSKV